MDMDKLVKTRYEDWEWLKEHSGGSSMKEKVHQLIVGEHHAPYDALEMENRSLKRQINVLTEIIEEMRGKIKR